MEKKNMIAQPTHKYDLDRKPQPCIKCNSNNTIKQGKGAGKKDYQKWFCHNCRSFFRTEVIRK